MSDSGQQPATFEEALKELDVIVRQLEDGDLGLEIALAQYESGVGLLKQCYAKLSDAEKRIQRVTGETADGQAVTELFEHTAAVKKAKK